MNEILVALPPTDLTMRVCYEGRQFESATEAKAAWERGRMASARLSDAGVSRCSTLTDASGRYLVYLTLGTDAWPQLAELMEGEPWEPTTEFVEYLILKRVRAAAMGSASFIHRSEDGR